MEGTIFVCPECGYWQGSRDGLHSMPGHCPRCLVGVKRARGGPQSVTTVSDVQAAPRLEPRTFATTQEQGSGDG